MTDKVIGIAGASGFIGKNLVGDLLARGCKIKASYRNSKPDQEHPDLDWQSLDLKSSEQIADFLDGVDFIIYLAAHGYPGLKTSSMEDSLRSQVLPTIGFLDQCILKGVEKVVFLSSGGAVYGDKGDLKSLESESCLPISSYGAERLVIENYIQIMDQRSECFPIILRVANPYGPYQGVGSPQGFVPAVMKAIVRNNPVNIFGDGLNIRDYIYVSDLAEAVYFSLLHTPSPGPINIGSGSGHSLLDVVSLVEEVSGEKVQLALQPGRSVDIRSSVLNVQRAKRELDWSAKTNFVEGLSKTWKWFEANANMYS